MTYTRDTLLSLLRGLPAALAGNGARAAALAARVRRAVAAELLRLARANFRRLSAGGVGADGTRWQPASPPRAVARVKAKRGPLLFRTGALYRGLVAAEGPGRITLADVAPHAHYHHAGTRTIPARPLYPERVPAVWWPPLLAAAREEIKKALREGVRG